MSTRFDYIKYDDCALALQLKCKEACIALEAAIAAIGDGGGREKAIAITQLEHVYARCGRAIRDDQLKRGVPANLQEGRSAE